MVQKRLIRDLVEIVVGVFVLLAFLAVAGMIHCCYVFAD